MGHSTGEQFPGSAEAVTGVATPVGVVLGQQLTPQRVEQLAAEYGFTPADIEGKEANLSEQERAWLETEVLERDALRRVLLGQPAPTLQEPAPSGRKQRRADLLEQACRASLTLEAAERAYELALAALARDLLFDRLVALELAQAARSLAWRLVERDVAGGFPQRVDPGDPLRQAYSSFYDSDAYLALRQAQQTDELQQAQPLVELRGRRHRAGQQLERRLARLAARRQAERDGWMRELEALRGQA